jgi:hypothetical protein
MEVLFTTNRSSGLLLSGRDACAEDPSRTVKALIRAIEAVESSEHLTPSARLLLSDYKTASNYLASVFYPAMAVYKEWVPSKREEKVINAACRDLYPFYEIEGAFHRYGGLHGILALCIVLKPSDSFRIKWEGIKSTLVQKWLAWSVSRSFREIPNVWVDKFKERWAKKPAILEAENAPTQDREFLGPHRERRREKEPEFESLRKYPYPTREELSNPLDETDKADFDGDIPHNDKRPKTGHHSPSEAFQVDVWSVRGTRDNNAAVILSTEPYLQRKRPHADGRLEDPEIKNKRRHVDRPGASASFPDHNFLPASLAWCSPGSNDFDQATYNTVEIMPGSNSSHLVSFDARNGSRYLTDPATACNLGYAVNRSDEFTDPATAGNLGYAITGSDEFTDLAIAEILNNADDQSVDALLYPDHRTIEPIQPTDRSIAGFLQWTVSGSNGLIDPSTDEFLRGATTSDPSLH